MLLGIQQVQPFHQWVATGILLAQGAILEQRWEGIQSLAPYLGAIIGRGRPWIAVRTQLWRLVQKAARRQLPGVCWWQGSIRFGICKGCYRVYNTHIHIHIYIYISVCIHGSWQPYCVKKSSRMPEVTSVKSNGWRSRCRSLAEAKWRLHPIYTLAHA